MTLIFRWVCADLLPCFRHRETSRGGEELWHGTVAARGWLGIRPMLRLSRPWPRAAPTVPQRLP